MVPVTLVVKISLFILQVKVPHKWETNNIAETYDSVQNISQNKTFSEKIIYKELDLTILSDLLLTEVIYHYHYIDIRADVLSFHMDDWKELKNSAEHLFKNLDSRELQRNISHLYKV